MLKGEEAKNVTDNYISRRSYGFFPNTFKNVRCLSIVSIKQGNHLSSRKTTSYFSSDFFSRSASGKPTSAIDSLQYSPSG